MPRDCQCELRLECQATPGSPDCNENFMKHLDRIAEDEGMGIVQIPEPLVEPYRRLVETTISLSENRNN